jgi:fructose-1,6-bisphosphatase/sedoheptulose 1,7-bisphosphatase-like protein
MGRGDKIAVDQAAVDAMRNALEGGYARRRRDRRGREGRAPMLIGEEVGNGMPPGRCRGRSSGRRD